ncbi:Zinc finger, RING/FYVE/PHD-type [Plasmopara halstedii]|uniref:Zinc finger, RING/FYVE/PHD-type n=1 Tax=Plasmopara halstedii TaxID=4781 RepID=A0A0P1ARQ0_PLAHL|nr:Zinc finger, RING/FYVE/PHD-type [Plasmopara halstedii]CEG43927.1 Zinc finger, RING/FYVE/PHD-type [Plasmopara halstedii]|eukprot:XP_024580296.1 Zinc finger, RING/FYVE/PHD-type [Plasmopara halstedii]
MRIHHHHINSVEFKSPFAPLHLAVEDEAQLEAVARIFVQNTVAQYEKFIAQDQRKVDCTQWKRIKHERDLRVFLQRRQKEVERRKRRHQRLRSIRPRNSEAVHFSDSDLCSSSVGSRNSTRSSVSSLFDRRTGSFASNFSQTNGSESRSPVYSDDSDSFVGPSTLESVELPVLQLVGSVPGSMDDAMYGSLGATVDAMRVKSAYERKNTTASAVLATINTPTTNDPFRSLTVKWIEQEGPTIDHHRFHPLHYPITFPGAGTREDLVFLEATGTTRLITGERIGYQLRHSVHFPQTHIRQNVRRGNMSTCTLFRDGDAKSLNASDGPCRGSVEVFARTCLSGGNAAVRSAITQLAATGAVVLCGRMKKLAWMLAQRQPPTQHMMGCIAHQNSLASLTHSIPPQKGRHGSLTVTVPAAAAASTAATDSKLCVTCKKRGPWFRASSMKKKPTTTCQLCWRYVCSSCRLKKTVTSCVTNTRCDDHQISHVIQRNVTLCNVCVHQSMVVTSARDVAREEIEADPKRWQYPSSTHARERVSDGYLQEHIQAQLSGSSRVTSAIRPVSIVSSTQ